MNLKYLDPFIYEKIDKFVSIRAGEFNNSLFLLG